MISTKWDCTVRSGNAPRQANMLRSGQNYTHIVERGSHGGQSELAGGCGFRPIT